MSSPEIYVWESALGWKVVEARKDEHGCPYSHYTVLQDGLRWAEAVQYAERLRRTLQMR
jgi:hypothetical protein